MKRPSSIQGRLLALVVGLVGGLWLIVAVMTWFDVRHELDELLDGHLAQAAALLVVQQTGEPEDDRGVNAPTLHKYAPKVAFQVFHEGRLVSHSAQAPQQPMIAMADKFQSGFRDVVIDGTAWRVFAAHGAERDVQVYVGERAESRMDILLAVMRSSLWPLIAALPVLAILLWWAVRQGLRPLRVLGETLSARDAETLQPVMLADAPSEMTPMLAALNALFARIEAMIESERRFTADAAHELRTPIAAIRAQAQVAQTATEPAQHTHALSSLLAGCDRATRLVDQMLQLARLEAAAAPPLSEINLVAIAREVLAEAAIDGVRKSQSIRLEGAGVARMRGDPVLLAVLVRNLVDNAIRYSPQGSAIEVRVAEDTNAVLLRIEDGGPGLADEAIERLGHQRFNRGLGTGESGSGLGWTIVRRIARLHGAGIDIRRRDAAGGLCVEIAFPRTGLSA